MREGRCANVCLQDHPPVRWSHPGRRRVWAICGGTSWQRHHVRGVRVAATSGSMAYGSNRSQAGCSQAAQTLFTALLHHLDEGALLRAFRRQKRRDATGVDGLRWRSTKNGSRRRPRPLRTKPLCSSRSSFPPGRLAGDVSKETPPQASYLGEARGRHRQRAPLSGDRSVGHPCAECPEYSSRKIRRH
ncbi:hypothetical protein ACVIQY_002158 [Bradyrhizobium sp. USDA 3051]